MYRIRRLLVMACIAVALCVLGCGHAQGPPRVAIRGAILFQDKPLKAGRIQFVPADGARGPTAVATVTDGFYDFDRLTGPIVGKHQIQIEAILNPGFELDNEAAYAAAVLRQGGGAVLPVQPIPPEFNTRTTLTATVSLDGEKKFDFNL